MLTGYFKHYEEFYNMLLGVTMMSNSLSQDFNKDASKIISFVGKAYKLDDDFIESCKDVILNELSSLALTSDQIAVYSSRSYGEVYTDRDALFDIKGDVLSNLQSLSKLESAEINSNWYDYTHYKTYQPEVRFSKINVTSGTGNIIATRQIGILRALGIGCEKDLAESIIRFKQCAFWGDIPSMYFMAYAMSLNGDKEGSKVYYELAALCNKYLYAGYTVLPEEVKKSCSERAVLLYVYISTIKQDIVYTYKKHDIDFSFLEALNDPSLDYYQRMNYINNYERKEWKEVTNSSQAPTSKLGFN